MKRAVVQVLLALLCAVDYASCLRFLLNPNRPVCVKEEIKKDVVVTGDYTFSAAPGMRNGIIVTDSKNHIFFKRENFEETHGKFAFTTDEIDVFEICISTTYQSAGMRSPPREVSLEIKHGIDAKDYEQLAKAEHLMPLETELRHLEDLSEVLVQDFMLMKHQEENIRQTNETTYARVLYLSAFSVVCLLSLATWQVLYLKRFFKSKKLID